MSNPRFKKQEINNSTYFLLVRVAVLATLVLVIAMNHA